MNIPLFVASAKEKFYSALYFQLETGTWLKSNMREYRLVGLALLNIHRHRDIQLDKFIDMVPTSKKKCIDFVL